MTLALSIHSPESATPGVATRGTVTVRNTGHQVRAIQLTTLGVDGNWVTLDSNTVKLFPDEQTDVGVTITATRGPAVPAGRHQFAIRATAADDATDQTTEETEVDVAPWTAVSAELRNSRTRWWRTPVARLTVLNAGNAQQAIGLAGGDDNDLVHVDPRPKSLVIAPGHRASVRVRLEHAPGAEGALPYWVQINDTHDSVLTTANATLTVRRKLPIGRVLAALAALAILVALLATRLTPNTTSAVSEQSVPTDPEATQPPTIPLATEPASATSAPPAASQPPAPGEAPASGAAAEAPAAPAGQAPQAAPQPAAPGSPAQPQSVTPGVTTTLPARPASTGVTTQQPAAESQPGGQSFVPEAPTFVDVIPSDGAVQLSWTSPANLAAADLQSYNLTWSSDGTAVGSLSMTETEFLVTPLENGRAYVFDVSATATNGATGPLTSSQPVVTSGLPGATTPVASSVGSASATLTWPAANPNGSPIVDYTVTVTGINPPQVRSAGTATTIALTGFSPTTTYVAVLSATNANGTTNSSPLTFTTRAPHTFDPSVFDFDQPLLVVDDPFPDPEPDPWPWDNPIVFGELQQNQVITQQQVGSNLPSGPLVNVRPPRLGP